MAKHAENVNKGVSAYHKAREEVMKQLFQLTTDLYNHIADSLKAVLPCMSCASDNFRKDAVGECFYCHGAGHVADVKRRDWASDRLIDRIAPAPKAIEMTVDDKRDTDELVDQYKDKRPEELKQLLTRLEVVENGK